MTERAPDSKKSLKRVRIDELANKHYHSNDHFGSAVLYNSDETNAYIKEVESKLSVMEQTLNKYKSLKNIFSLIDGNSKGLSLMCDTKKPRVYADPLLDFEFQLIKRREKEMALHIFNLEEKVQAFEETQSGGAQEQSNGLIKELESSQKEIKLLNLSNFELKEKVQNLTAALSTSRNRIQEVETANERFISQIFFLQQQLKAYQGQNAADDSKT